MDSLFFDLAKLFCLIGAVVLVGCFVWNVFWVFEWAYQPCLTENGKVIDKGFVSSYEERVLCQSFSDSGPDIPILYQFPDSWWVEVQVFSRKIRLDVSHQTFEALEINDTVTVQYRSGRITGRPHVQTIVDV